MADYKFDKPWAAESQNVQTFTEEEWGTGIVEKSLVSSSQVNGVMQAVTRRFLNLEAVEDRQYRYDFVVDDEKSWNDFIDGNMSRLTNTVVIRKGTWVADTKVKLTYPSIIAVESGATIQFNAGVDRSTDSGPAIIFGGSIIGNLTNCIIIGGGVAALKSATFVKTVFENSTLFVPGNYSVSGGEYFQSVIDSQGGITGAKFVDCEIKNVKTLTNCTLIRCTIPANTPLSYCTVINCDYAVNTFAANLIISTTFRNCNITFTTTTETAGAVCDATNKAYGSTIEFHLAKSEHVSFLVYDSSIKFYRGEYNSLFTDSQFFGTSYMDVGYVADRDVINTISKFEHSEGSIITDVPFFRDSANFFTYNSTDTIYPGVINIVPDNNTRTIGSYGKRQKFFLNFTGDTSNTLISYGRFKFIPWCRATKSITDDSYNIEFIAGSESAV